MFKKVFQSLAARFTQRDVTAADASLRNKPGPAVSKMPSGAKSALPAAAQKVISKTPEEWCGITPKMSKDDIRDRLAFIYRRYNRATSSLDPKLRAEAEIMLDAVVDLREKTFGPI